MADKLKDIRDALDRLYGHLAITAARESELRGEGYREGFATGYQQGREAGLQEGYEEGKVFPNVKVA